MVGARWDGPHFSWQLTCLTVRSGNPLQEHTPEEESDSGPDQSDPAFDHYDVARHDLGSGSRHDMMTIQQRVAPAPDQGRWSRT